MGFGVGFGVGFGLHFASLHELHLQVLPSVVSDDTQRSVAQLLPAPLLHAFVFQHHSTALSLMQLEQVAGLSHLQPLLQRSKIVPVQWQLSPEPGHQPHGQEYVWELARLSWTQLGALHPETASAGQTTSAAWSTVLVTHMLDCLFGGCC